MLTADAILDFITAEPFRPFRMHLSSGRTFEVSHPEMVWVGRTMVTVASKLEGERCAVNPWHQVPLTLLESIEPRESPGRRKRQ